MSQTTTTNPRVIAAAVVPARRAHVIRELNAVVARGGSAVLLTNDGGTRPAELDAAVQHVDIAGDLQRVGMHRLLSVSPARVAARLLGRRRGGPSWAWRTWSNSRPFRAIRPWLLWRATRRHLSELDVMQIDHVILVSSESWPVAWQLCQIKPGITVGWEVPDDLKVLRSPE